MDQRDTEDFEQDAEKLVVYQTDVMAQVENQLRAARNTIRLITKLRSTTHRPGRGLTTGQRNQALDALSAEWAAMDAELTTQHESCVEIQKTIAEMRERLNSLRVRNAVPRADAADRDRSAG